MEGVTYFQTIKPSPHHLPPPPAHRHYLPVFEQQIPFIRPVSNKRPVYQMTPVHPHKTLGWQQVFEPLQNFTNKQRRMVGKKYPTVVAAAFNANNIGGLQIHIAAKLPKRNDLHN